MGICPGVFVLERVPGFVLIKMETFNEILSKREIYTARVSPMNCSFDINLELINQTCFQYIKAHMHNYMRIHINLQYTDMAYKKHNKIQTTRNNSNKCK